MHQKDDCPACRIPLRADGTCSALPQHCRHSGKVPPVFDAKATGGVPAQRYQRMIEQSRRTNPPPPMATTTTRDLRVPNRSLSPKPSEVVTLVPPSFSQVGETEAPDENPWKSYIGGKPLSPSHSHRSLVWRRIVPGLLILCGLVLTIGLLFGYRVRIESQDARASGTPPATGVATSMVPRSAPARSVKSAPLPVPPARSPSASP